MDQRLIFSIVLTIFSTFKYEGPYSAQTFYKVVARSPIRIVNGTTAEDGEFPYMVQLRSYSGFFKCGGAIIGSEWILTAGHCIEDEDIDLVIYGTNMLYEFYDGVPDTAIKVKTAFQHPKYALTSTGVPTYDVAILQLETPIPLSAIAQIIKLAEANTTIPIHVEGDLSGWGVNNTWGDAMKYLQKIKLPLLSDAECTDKINGFSGVNSFLPIHHLCSDDYYNGECFGDSGSPYVINGIQYGIVSWSYTPCGIVPGAYSRISNPEYRNWIIEVTNI